MQSILCCELPPVAALFLFGLFWPRANARGAFFGVVFATLAGGALFLMVNLIDQLSLRFIHAAPLVLQPVPRQLQWAALPLQRREKPRSTRSSGNKPTSSRRP
ncbi:hypothetical protein [Altererythrobacter sp. GH1-8]|uniref:hypothetical protein n=1 Tax=Altererythrobacter sp. GH1-8 TaxID=3349333 RepID=UPI00374CAA5D